MQCNENDIEMPISAKYYSAFSIENDYESNAEKYES